MYKRKVLILGAGSAGQMIADDMINDVVLSEKYEIVGFLDDNESIHNILGCPVLGKISDLKMVVDRFQVEEVIIAIPSAESNVIRGIIRLFDQTAVKVRIVPGTTEIIEGKVGYKNVRIFDPVDLLGREEIGFKERDLQDVYNEKTIFVTGAGGSIGSEILSQLLSLPVKRVIAFGHGENSIHTLITKHNDERFIYVIGDIRDYKKISREMARFRPDMVFHAAAHKHVPLMEHYPDEAVKNNIIGSYQCMKAAIRNRVKQFIFVSTDKAVNPTSIMGGTKRIAEKIALSLGRIQKTTRFQITRFGNVLGSRGSVVLLFKEQIENGGPVCVTHPEVTRFFMSIREAARLVIKAGTIDSGEIFTLDMGQPVKIMDLARNMIRLSGNDIEKIGIRITGLRAGEKLYEEVLTEDESLVKTKYDKLFVSTMPQKAISLLEIFMLLLQFKRASQKIDKERIRHLIRKYVPEFAN